MSERLHEILAGRYVVDGGGMTKILAVDVIFDSGGDQRTVLLVRGDEKDIALMDAEELLQGTATIYDTREAAEELVARMRAAET